MLSSIVVATATLLRIGTIGPDVTVVVDSLSVATPSVAAVELIQSRASIVARRVQAVFPDLTDEIRLRFRVVDGDLDPVGGVAGWAARPGTVQLLVSATYPGGIEAAIEDGLETVLYHEFHHLWRGWTIEENRFGPGIPTAVVNEGLAAVFADEFSGVAWERFDYPDHVHDWLEEILRLPPDADYDSWMNDHPDGRVAVGYRTGRYVIHQAMARSGLGIVEISALDPEEILAMVRE